MRAVAWLKALTSCANARLSLNVITLILEDVLPRYHIRMTTILAALFLPQSLVLLKEIPSFVFVQVG